jgi:small subunit ribosomal protein S20
VAKRNKSALKANRQNIKRREHNRALRAKLRTGLKSIRKSLDDKNIEGAKTALKTLQSLVDKMATKGIIHKNTASRYKSRLSAKISKS